MVLLFSICSHFNDNLHEMNNFPGGNSLHFLVMGDLHLVFLTSASSLSRMEVSRALQLED